MLRAKRATVNFNPGQKWKVERKAKAIVQENEKKSNREIGKTCRVIISDLDLTSLPFCAVSPTLAGRCRSEAVSSKTPSSKPRFSTQVLQPVEKKSFFDKTNFESFFMLTFFC